MLPANALKCIYADIVIIMAPSGNRKRCVTFIMQFIQITIITACLVVLTSHQPSPTHLEVIVCDFLAFAIAFFSVLAKSLWHILMKPPT